MTKCDRTTIGIYARIVVIHAQLTQHRKSLSGESFVQFDDIDRIEFDSGARQQLLRRGHRTDTHDARSTPGGGNANHAGKRCKTVLSRRRFTGKNQCARTVVYPGCVTRRNRSAGFDDAFQFCECL